MILDFIKNNKESKNALWIISGKVIQMSLSLIVTIFSARFLGPGNYGILNYAKSFVVFFNAFCTLGINGVIINDFVEYPNETGTAIGTTLVMRTVSSILSSILIISIVALLDHDEPVTIIVTALCSLALIFQVYDTFNYWFQSNYMSKFSSIASVIGYIVVSGYQIVLLVLKKNVIWFAVASSIDYLVIAIALYIAYKRKNGPRLRFSLEKGKKLLGKSYHFILASMMVAIYSQTDKLMLKQMLNETEVGYYTTGTTVCGMWTFILTAIIDSIYPTIINLKKHGVEADYRKKNVQLYTIVFYMSIAVSLCFQFLGKPVIMILYGEEYIPSAPVLKIITWYTAFSYLGVARGAWLICENKQKYLKYMYIAAAGLNVVLNWFMIPSIGASGAALASLITQLFTSIVLPLLIPGMRENALMMIDAIRLKELKNMIKLKG